VTRHTLARQIFATKSIDKLISDSELPQHALKKTLGPLSLTAMGVGIVIGSGIFTVIGTAIAGMPNVTSRSESPVIDLIWSALHHTGGLANGMGGRPGAGPALVISLVLVATVCALTGLCYAELASMIPISGSAYTYSYATMGELVAWIIGWDLILEYAFANMSVSVGFAAHLVDLLDWLGIHLNPKWLAPALLPEGLQDLAGKDIFAKGWHFGFEPDNFTSGLHEYYGYKHVVVADAALLVEGGELTCPAQAAWLHAHADWEAASLAHFLSLRLHKGNISDPAPPHR